MIKVNDWEKCNVGVINKKKCNWKRTLIIIMVVLVLLYLFKKKLKKLMFKLLIKYVQWRNSD